MQFLVQALDFKLANRNLLITYHPVTLEHGTSRDQMKELLAALQKLDNVGLIFTMPNADTDSRILFDQINDFCLVHSNARVFTSLGQLRYLSCIQYMDGVIGNSSSGLLEVPSFKKGTVNIGDRQRGRLRAESVIDCPADQQSIEAAIKCLFSPSFLDKLPSVSNPYGNGGASHSIVKKLEKIQLDNLLKKPFFDLPFEDNIAI